MGWVWEQSRNVTMPAATGRRRTFAPLLVRGAVRLWLRIGVRVRLRVRLGFGCWGRLCRCLVWVLVLVLVTRKWMVQGE